MLELDDAPGHLPGLRPARIELRPIRARPGIRGGHPRLRFLNGAIARLQRLMHRRRPIAEQPLREHPEAPLPTVLARLSTHDGANARHTVGRTPTTPSCEDRGHALSRACRNATPDHPPVVRRGRTSDGGHLARAPGP